MSQAGDGPAVQKPELQPFLSSTLFVLPWISWQAWVLGASFRQRRGQLQLAAAAAAAETEAQTQAQATAGTAGGAAAGNAAPQATAEGTASQTTNKPVLDRWRSVVFVVGVSSLFIAAQAWLGRVLETVPEPYLDEVFHIPQAQKYCAEQWEEWDSKITTPPGLYLFSYVYQGFWSRGVAGCSVWALRGANNIAVMLLAIVTCSCRAEIEHQKQFLLEGKKNKSEEKKEKPTKLSDSTFSLYAFHTAINVALFPVIFFFTALYYTDVYSALVVLLAYRNHLFRRQFGVGYGAAAVPPSWNDLVTVVLGLAALVMRQTNVFWIVVYLGGLEAVQAIKGIRFAKKQAGQAKTAVADVADGKFSSLAAMVQYYLRQWTAGNIHDPPVSQAWPDDWLVSLVSIAIAAIGNLFVVLSLVWPYLAVLAAFVYFVYLNGGVVLGDKSNHVATVHLAQLLYLWPLIAFFSAPLFVAYILRFVGGNNKKKQTESQETAQVEKATPAVRGVLAVLTRKTYYPVYLAASVVFCAAIVHFNTIIHPFTLADNRHYMFYVFRYTVRQPLVRYALVPVYAACAWFCWRALFGSESTESTEAITTDDKDWVQSPFAPFVLPPVVEEEEEVEEDEETKGKEKGSKGANRNATTRRRKPAKPAKAKKAKKTAEAEANTEDATPSSPSTSSNDVFLSLLDEEPAASASRAPAATSAALLWFLATALSLVTAPLVEPRYFILPWVFWRLLVPADTIALPGTSPLVQQALRRVDVRLVLETVWFAAINVATMYVFLYQPYVWHAEDGSVLDEGRLQRFMW